MKITRFASLAQVSRFVRKLLVLLTLPAFVSAAAADAGAQTGTALIRHAPSINGTVEGSVHMMLPESLALNGNSLITDDLLVPGTPQVRLNGKPTYGGTVDGEGAAAPTGYKVTLNGGADVRHVVRRTDPVTLASVSAPPAPTGTRSVTLNSPGQSPGGFSTLRNLSLNGNVGAVAVPAGTYGDFTANSGSAFVLGVAGATEASVYNFQRLTLNGQSRLEVVGPVIVTVANGLTGNGAMGSTERPDWLTLNIASGGITLNGGCVLHAFVNAPSGTVIINGHSLLVGGLISDRLIINGGGVLRLRTGGGTGPTNSAPEATSQALTLAEDTELAITLQASDAENDPLGFTVLTQPTHGTLSGTAPALTYTPNAHYHGSDSFTFVANDGLLDSNVATVSLTVTPKNDAPVATPLTFRTDEDTPLALVLAGTDADGDPLVFTIVTSPTRGVLSGTAAELTYTPQPNIHGVDTFTYTVSDGESTSAPATVTIEIIPVNDAPVAQPQSLVVNEGETLPIVLTATDADGDVLTFAVVTMPSLGTVSGDAPHLTYVPPANTNAIVTLVFSASDGTAAPSQAVVSIEVRDVLSAPVANPQSHTLMEDTSVEILLAGTDADGDALTYEVRIPPAHGTLSGTAPALVYTPNANFSGDDSFTFVARDASLESESAVVTLTVTPVNDAPVAEDRSVTTPEDTSVDFSVTAEDMDGDTLTYVVTTPPSHGALVLTPGTTDQFTFTPSANYHGDDTIAFTVSDGIASPVPFTVAITVTPVNDAPVVDAGADASITLPAFGSLAGTATDADGDALTYMWARVDGPGDVVFEHPEQLTTRAEFATAGTYVLRLTASDGALAGSDDVTVTVNASNLVFRTYTTSEDFAEGVNSNVNTEVPDQLQLNAESSASHFLWVAVSSKGTVVKINTRTGRIEGEYWSAPAGQPRNPSRTTVDLRGAVWTGNRDGNSVVHIGSVESGMWIDKNGNGQPDTSVGYGDLRAWTNVGGADTAGGVSTAADECIIHYVRTSSTGTRHVSVTRDNHIWVSGTGNRKFDLIDGDTGTILRTEGGVGHGGYGGLIDRQGVIWSSTWNSLLRWDTAKPLAGTAGDAWSLVPGSGQYGLALAPDGYVWASSNGANRVYKIAPDGTVVGQYPQGANISQGIAVDRRGHVWIAHSLYGNTVGHLLPDGTYVGTITVGSGPTGVAVDGDGKIWVTNFNAGTVSRIDPLAGPIGSDGETPVGAVDFTSPYLGGQVYNYSDMTGSTLVAPPLTGVWTTTFDSGKPDTAWGSINWHAKIYDDSKITITVASSVDNVTFSPWRVGVRGQDLDVPNGRYLKINVLFQRSTTGHSPELYDLTVGEEGYLPDYPFNTAPEIEAPARQAANYGVEAELEAKVGDDGLPHPSSLSYEWSVVSGPGTVTFDGATRTDAIATFSTTGNYVLRLTATDGQYVVSEDISVIANLPPTVNAGPDLPVREAGGTATFAGSVYDDGASLDGLHTEWAQVFGPATATFNDTSLLAPVVTFPAAGRYYFELVASDGWSEARDRMEVRVGPATSSVVPRDPVAWWPFDANYLDVVGGRVASPRGAPLVSTMLGRGIALSGAENSQAIFTADGSLDVGVSTAGFTMELWVNPTSFRDVMLLEWGTATTAQTSLRQWSSGRGLYAYLLGTDGQFRSIGATNVFAVNTWQHVAVTYDRVTGWARLYRDAALVAEQHLGSFDVQTTQDLHIGGCLRENRWFQGMLDEVAIYDRPLTATEIRALHAASDTGRPPYSNNQSPVVSAGEHQVLHVPGAVSFQGVVTDDGPVEALNYAWRLVSGPAAVELAESASLTPTADLPLPGTYVFELRADDGLLAAIDHVEARVGVTAPAGPGELAAWWPLNGHPREVINGNHDLELMNGLTYAPGRVSEGLVYDGANDFARTAGHAELDVGVSPDGFTVELWVNPTTFRDVPLVEWGTPAASQTWIAQWSSGRGLYAFLMGEDGVVRTVAAQNVFATGVWQHIAVSYDRPSGWARLFRDGVLLHEQHIGSFAVRTTQDITIGSRPRENRWFHGSLDEPTLYSRALTATEIASIHSAGAVGKAPADGNVAPQVNAGPDRALLDITGAAVLSGVISDDGLPAGGGLVTLWTQLSGPGTAIFANVASAETTVSFDQPGTYVLRLQAGDGLLATADEVEVRVGVTAVPPPSQVAAWWPLNAHPREVINGDHDLNLMNGLTYAIGRVSDGLAYDGVNDFARTAGHDELNVGASVDGFTVELWVNPSSYRDAPLVEWGTPTTTQTWIAQWSSGRGLYAFLIDEDNATRTIFVDNVFVTNTWQHVAVSYDRPSGWARLYLNGVLLREQHIGSFAVRTTQDVYVGSRPRENRWFHGSIDEPTFYSRALSASEITAIHLAGTAGKAPADGNAAPQVNAGPDRVLANITGEADLAGTISDDGLPSGGRLAALWTQLSGPGTATFADTTTAQTTVSFDQPGTYVLQLRATDGLLASTDLVEVRVGVMATPTPSTVAAWWPLNGHLREVINGNHDLELMNGLDYAPGRIAQGLVYDGANDFARTAGHAELDVGASTDGFTVELWVNPASYRDVALVEWGTPTTTQTWIAQWNSGRGFYAFLMGEDGVTRTVSINNVITTGQWQHIAVSYDRPSGWVRLFRNGVLLHEQHIGSFAVRTSHDFYLGARPRSLLWFQGSLDEPTLYARALNATEIASIHAAGAAGKAPFDGNTPPHVNAGADQVIATTNDVAALVGDVQDDGSSAGGGLSVHWSQLSGPGVATFGDASAEETTVSFDQPGTYVLQLEAYDGLFVGSDQIEVRVGVTALALPSQVAAWWPLNGHPREVINGNHDLELMNGLTYASGRVAQGLAYDGVNDFARTAGHAELDVGTSADGFTVELWVNPASHRDVALVEWGTPATTQTWIAQWSSGRGLYAFLVGEDGGTRTVSVENIFTLNAWQHIAVSYDRPTGWARLYRNGVLIREQNIGSFAVRTSQDFYLGARPRSNLWFHGTLDEPTLYSRALTGAEIADIHAAGLVGKAPPVENRAPVITIGAPQTITQGQPLTLAPTVEDDGLPAAAVMTFQWTRLSGPGNVTFSAENASTTDVGFDAPGSYVLRLTVSDTRLSTSVEMQVTVLAPQPVVALTAPADGAQLVSGSPVTLTANASVTPGAIQRVEFYNGEGLLGIATTPVAASSYSFNLAGGLPSGTHVLTARAVAASTGATATSAQVTVTAAPYTGPQVVEISTPDDGARITAATPITGIVARPALASWKVEYRLIPAAGTPLAQAPWLTLASGSNYVGTPAVGATPAAPGEFGTIDPTLLINGLYELRLSATTSGGSVLIAPGPSFLVEGNMKVGAFTLAFEDLVETTGGVPITFTRSYDSRDRRAGDFGPGWHLTLGNIRVQKNTSIAEGWEQMADGSLLSQVYFIEPTRKHLVTVTFPDGETHRFEAGIFIPKSSGPALPDNYQWLVPIQQGRLVFKPVGDTTSTLAVDGDNISYFSGMLGEEILTQGLPFVDPPFEPTRFRLTAADGTVMIVDEKLGLLEMREPTGNRLVIHRRVSDGRIESIDSIQAHADGPITRTVEIARHPDGRVDHITDLAGRTLDYLYDPQGRLSSFTDREENVTQFFYEKSDAPSHPQFAYLTKILDPRGLPALRSEYDDEGRLVKQIDADGNETVFDRGIGDFGRFEKVTDRLGHATTYFYDDRGNVTAKVDPLGATTTYDYYPDSDRVKFEEDHYGNVKGFAYDARGNVTIEIQGASRTQEPATATTGYITRTTYTTFSAPLTITDPDGRVQSFTYDPATQQLLTHTVGQLAPGASPEIVGAPPASTTYTYHADGNVNTVTDALGNVTTTSYTYGYTDPAYPGAVKRVTTTVVDPAGALGSDTTNANATTLRTTYNYYDAQENVLATVTPRTLPDGTVEVAPTRYAYDAENRVRFTVLPDGRIQETRYTSFGQTDKTLDWPIGTDLTALIAAGPNGPTTGARVTSMSYDTRGNLERTTLPDGTFTAAGYDSEGRILWSQDARGYRLFTVYDEVGRPRFTIRPDPDDGTFNDAPSSADDPRLTNNPRSETRYDLVGRVSHQIDERGSIAETRYFADGTPHAGRREKLVQHLDGTELVTSFSYTPSGHVRSVTDPGDNTTHTRYDSHGRSVRILHPATDEHPATETATNYNALGQRVATIDAEGKLTRYRHDSLGRLLEVRQYLDQGLAAGDAGFTQPASAAGIVSTTYAYDEAGNQVAQIDARDHVTRYEHDAVGRRLKRTLPASGMGVLPASETLRYNVWGDLWQRDDFAGRTTVFGYDPLHRLKTKQADPAHPSLVHAHAVALVEYDYDDDGAREAARTYNASGVLLYTEATPRDERGRVQHKDTPATRLDYDYYANGLLKDVVSSSESGVNIGYRYDALNRLSHVDDATRGLPVRTTAYTYTVNGSLESFTHANGLRHAYRYDSLNRLRGLDVGQAAGLPAPALSSILRSYDHQLRASGHRREVVESGALVGSRLAAYAYDDLYRLTGETVTGDPLHSGAVSYTIDKVGNREARVSNIVNLPSRTGIVFNGRDQLSTDTYDANGNTGVGQTAGPAPSSPDVYDFEDRLIVRTRADGSAIHLGYDADGLRVQKTILNSGGQFVSTTHYVLDTNNLTEYAQIVEESTTDSVASRLKTYTYGHDLLSETSHSTLPVTRYFLYDGGGSVRALVDESGSISDRYTYDAFGVLLEHAGTSENPYLYRGEQWDADLGLYYLRARFMNPDSGRFWNQDTYEGQNADPASLHKYLYANANPVVFSDPSGNFSLGEVNISQAISNTLSKMANSRVGNYLRRAFVGKISDVFLVTTKTIPGLPSHWFIYINHDKGNVGLRFDVGVNDIKGFMRKGWKKYVSVFDGFLAFRPDTLANVMATSFKRFKIARFNKAQEALWVGIMGISMTMDRTPVSYSVPGYPGTTNCYKWTAIAAASAFAIQFLPIK